MRKALIAILSVALAFALNWGYATQRRLAEKVRLEREARTSVAQLETRLDHEVRLNRTVTQAQRELVESLRRQLEDERPAFEAAQQRLAIARNRGLPGNGYTLDIENKLRVAQDALKELDAQIKGQAVREDDLGKQGKLAQEQQRLDARTRSAELDGQIIALQGQIQDTQAHLQSPQSAESRKVFKARLAEQKLQLQALKNARGQLSAQTGEAVNSIGGQVQAQRSQLHWSREQLQADYRQQQNVVADLKKQLDQAKHEGAGLKQELAQLEAAFQIERDKASLLKTRFDEEKHRLKALEGE